MLSPGILLRLVLVVLTLTLWPAGVRAADEDGSYETGFIRWTGNGLSGFSGRGVRFDGTQLLLDLSSAQTETDPGGMYNGGSYRVGEAVGPAVPVSSGFAQAIASWNATTPSGTWLEVLMSARFGNRWTKWYNMGVWASGTDTIKRHSVRLQADPDGSVAVDTLILAAKPMPADALRLKVRLFTTDPALQPGIRRLAVTYSTTPPKQSSISKGDPTNWGIISGMPQCSQMIYRNGGNVWCSPTSTSMVLGYWGIDPGACYPRVKAAVAGVYDYVYRGYGNWSFNTAYAASRGLEAYIVRYTGLDEVEPWVKAGLPVVVSYAWKKGELSNAPIPSSSGHLGVLVGFDANGNPVLNDPAASSDAGVQRTYLRSEFERLWLANSGGTVYLIFPPGTWGARTVVAL